MMLSTIVGQVLFGGEKKMIIHGTRGRGSCKWISIAFILLPIGKRGKRQSF
jgi:hypothetical protein